MNAPASVTDIQVTGSAQNGGLAGRDHGHLYPADQEREQPGCERRGVLNGTAFESACHQCQFPAGDLHRSKAGAAGLINCGVSSLGVGQTMVVTVIVSVPIPGVITVTGTATFNGTDTNAANNSFPVTIQVK